MDHLHTPDHLSLLRRLEACWSPGTSADPARWTPENPSWGQCAVTCAVVQDELGGDVVWGEAVLPDGERLSHYWNRVGGTDVDLTRAQFPDGTQMPPGGRRKPDIEDTRGYVLATPATKARYDILHGRVTATSGGDDLRTLLGIVVPAIAAAKDGKCAEEEARAALRTAAAWFLPDIDLSAIRIQRLEFNGHSMGTLHFALERGQTAIPQPRVDWAGNTMSLLAPAMWTALSRTTQSWGAIRPVFVSEKEVRQTLQGTIQTVVYDMACLLHGDVAYACKASQCAVGHEFDLAAILQGLDTLGAPPKQRAA